MGAPSSFDSFFLLTVTSIVARNQVQPRRWGMLVTVTDDSTSSNNITWQLKKGYVTNDINDDDNWIDAGVGVGAETISVISQNTRQVIRALEPVSSAITGQIDLMQAAELDNGEAVFIRVDIIGKRDSANTGFAGIYQTAWSKAAGAIQQIMESGANPATDTGGTITVSTIDNGGQIRIELTNNLAANMSWSWVATLTFRKAT